MTSVTLAQATAIAITALARGRDAGLAPLTVAVLDAGGHLVVLQREDGSGILRPEIAIGKAWGALGMGTSSRTLRDRMADRQNFVSAVSAASNGRFVPVPGGVLIRDDSGNVIGAVGISGDASDKDEYCAIEGVKATGLTPDPAEPNPDWQNALP